MTKKLLLVFSVLLLLPSFANAWYVNAKASPATGYGTISPSGNKIYATGVNSGEYTVTPANGGVLNRVTLDGVALAPNVNGKYVVPYKAGVTWRYLVAFFSAPTLSITTQVTGGGVIREDTGESLTSIPLGASRQLLVLPNANYTISAVSAPGATITDQQFGVKLVTYTNLQTSKTVSATFAFVPQLSVSAGNDATANGTGSQNSVTLYGSATSNEGAITYAWSGAGLTFGSPNSAVTTVYSDNPGTYTATLTATSASLVKQDSAIVTVMNNSDYLNSQCTSCHAGNTPQVLVDYNASPHNGKISCQGCHTVQPHDGYIPVCVNCHTPGNSYGLSWPPTGFEFHNTYTGQNVCTNCHAPHNPTTVALPYPHFASYTTAQYVTPKVTCDSCHTSKVDNSFNVWPANVQWARSGKADPASLSWTAYDFKTKGTVGAKPSATTSDDCVRCHTSTGFANFVDSGYNDIAPWGISGDLPGGDRTREMITCAACHQTPFDAYYSTRGMVLDEWDPGAVLEYGPPTVSGYFNYSSQATQKIIVTRTLPQSIGVSNLCASCHIGRASGTTIKAMAQRAPGAGTGAFWQNVGFVNPHYMGAAGTIYQLTGYTYRTATAYTAPDSYAHSGLGNGTKGNCVTCHMSSSEKHSYSAVAKNAGGVITSIASARCQDCHAGGLHPIPDGASLQAIKDGYQASLAAVVELLAAKGIYFNDSKYPYFFTTSDPAQQSYATRTVNWDAGAPTYKGADVMGAAFNLKLLQSDVGAYAHNSFYTKRLLYDTVDYLDGGDADSTYTTLQNLPVTATFTDAMKTKALAYIGARP
uniref:Cytochrome c-552/4 domain-containing protein n=1 Tax=Geobacter sp. (strain M21) TaxID=443144 RepID=C6E3I9_GEOSM